MKTAVVFALTLFGLAACGHAEDPPATAEKAKPGFETVEQRASYAIGMRFGSQMKQGGFTPDVELLIAGLRDGLAEAEPQLSQEEMQSAMAELNKKMSADMEAKRAEQAAANLETGTAFLEENGKREGVTTTASGLQYEVLTMGDGPKPTADDRVTVHYTGTLVDGTVFDSSVERGQPATFPLKGVIKGWTEALQLMPVGSKWKLYIPPAIGYGDKQAGPKIGPNSVLIFEVELLGIEPKKE